jgi:hypothetical protein
VQAATIFSEDYEVTVGFINGTQTRTDLATRGWGVVCSSSPCTSDIWSMAGHTGAMTKAIRMTYAGTYCRLPGPVCDDSKVSNIYRGFAGKDEIYERYWVRYEKIAQSDPSPHVSDLNVTAVQHYFESSNVFSAVFGFNFFDGLLNSPGFTVRRNLAVTCPTSGSMPMTCSYPQNRSGTIIPFNQWVCVETHQKMNTVVGGVGLADGVIEVWLNGTLTTQYTNVIYRTNTATSTSKFNFIRVVRHGADNRYRYEDDFVLADTRVGCSGAPQSSDTTPPTAPTNMIVR